MSGGDREPRSEQPEAPYLDALISYAFRGAGRFHVPGHKGGDGADPALRAAIGQRALEMDIPKGIEGIDDGASPTPFDRAETLAAEAHGAAQTWFLTNGATQGNHALCLALARLGDEVVLQRNAHASLVDGLVLSGGLPRFAAPAYDDELGMAHGVTPDALAEAFEPRQQTKPIRAAFVVSPTYYGLCADIEGLVRVAHAAGAALVVDQAWGPHFGFHPDLPPSALALGADAVLTSTHKIVGSLTQSAMLHVGHGARIDVDAVTRAIRLVRSTSPSSLLLGSLDGARRQLAVHGEALLHTTLVAIAATRAKLATIPGLALIGPELIGTPGVADWDPLRIVLDVRGTGRSGYEVAAALRGSYDLQPELATQATVVFVVGLAERADVLERMAGDVEEVVKRIARPGVTEAVVRGTDALGSELVVSPREAFLGVSERVAVSDAIGRVSCESIAGYPPGIPALLPGERVTAETIDYLHRIVAAGARLHGAADPTLATITVLASA